MFWKEKLNTDRPIGVPSCVGHKIIKLFQKMPLNSTNRWMIYKAVIRQRNENCDEYDIRIFEEGETQLAKVKVANFNSLDKYPNLIQFEGWFNPKSKLVEIGVKNQTDK
jgi:hypothetical protein